MCGLTKTIALDHFSSLNCRSTAQNEVGGQTAAQDGLNQAPG